MFNNKKIKELEEKIKGLVSKEDMPDFDYCEICNLVFRKSFISKIRAEGEWKTVGIITFPINYLKVCVNCLKDATHAKFENGKYVFYKNTESKIK